MPTIAPRVSPRYDSLFEGADWYNGLPAAGALGAAADKAPAAAGAAGAAAAAAKAPAAAAAKAGKAAASGKAGSASGTAASADAGGAPAAAPAAVDAVLDDIAAQKQRMLDQFLCTLPSAPPSTAAAPKPAAAASGGGAGRGAGGGAAAVDGSGSAVAAAETRSGGLARAVVASSSAAAGAGVGAGAGAQQQQQATPMMARRDESCQDACSRQQKRCDAGRVSELNTCESMRKHFDCQQCSNSIGADQPALVAADAPPESQPGACLVNDGPVSCDGSHALTTRLCACVL